MRGAIRHAVGWGLASLLLATIIGLLAPLYPPADIANHFIPHRVAALVLVAVLASTFRFWRELSWSFALLFANTLLALLPLMSIAVASHSQSPGAPERTLVVVSVNVFNRNPNPARVTDWLRRQDADIAVLQEVSPANRGIILPRLTLDFPHVHDCGSLVMASRRPWVEATCQDRTRTEPAVGWLRFAGADGRAYAVAGLRVMYPLRPFTQVRHYRWLEERLARNHVDQETTILIGDFNATPWSYRLQRLAWLTGYVRHGTWTATWKADMPPLPAQVLIDNVLATADVRAISFETGPGLGSDHLPIKARVQLP